MVSAKLLLTALLIGSAYMSRENNCIGYRDGKCNIWASDNESCLTEMLKPFESEEVVVCIRCRPGYTMEGYGVCSKIPEDQKIPGCVAQAKRAENDYICLICEGGFPMKGGSVCVNFKDTYGPSENCVWGFFGKLYGPYSVDNACFRCEAGYTRFRGACREAVNEGCMAEAGSNRVCSECNVWEGYSMSSDLRCVKTTNLFK